MSICVNYIVNRYDKRAKEMKIIKYKTMGGYLVIQVPHAEWFLTFYVCLSVSPQFESLVATFHSC